MRRTNYLITCEQLPDDLTCRRSALLSLTGIFGLCCFPIQGEAAEDPQTQLSEYIGNNCLLLDVHFSGKHADNSQVRVV